MAELLQGLTVRLSGTLDQMLERLALTAAPTEVVGLSGDDILSLIDDLDDGAAGSGLRREVGVRGLRWRVRRALDLEADEGGRWEDVEGDWEDAEELAEVIREREQRESERARERERGEWQEWN